MTTHLGNNPRRLRLHEPDLADTNAGLGRVANFNQAIQELDTTNEPWLAEWLTAEHLKAAILYGTAHVNWRKEQAEGADTTFNAATRAAIIRRFNDWATQARSRLEQYEQSSRTASDVTPWRAALAEFRDDPVNNH